MHGFFNPASVAIIGVSPRPGNLGRNIVNNFKLFGFKGPVYGVSPRGGEYKGQPIYTDVRDLPETPEMAVILTPAKAVPEMLEACGQKGIKRVVVESGGFSELDASQSQAEQRLKDIASQYGMRFIGPNCIGVISTHSGVCTPFPLLEAAAPQGGVSIIAQSGGIGLTYLAWAAQAGIGVAKFASVGNKLNVNEEDLLAYLLQDEQTKAIMLYLESIVDGRRLFELIRSSKKPVVVHKSNIAELSHGIAQSHTAALANDDLVVEEALKQAGALRAHTVGQAMCLLKSMALPRPKGKRLAIISRSGGHAVVAADEAYRQGASLAVFPASYLESIQAHTRASVIRLQNPLDLGDLFEFKLYVEILRGALEMETVDAVIMVHGYRGPEIATSRQFAAQAGELSRKYGKPVGLVILAEPAEIAMAQQLAGMPVFTTAEDAIYALCQSAELGLRPAPQADTLGCADDWTHQRAERVARILQAANPDGGLELPEALRLVEAAGVAVAPFAVAGDAGEAAYLAKSLGFPVALKAVGGHLSHKTEQGGVVIDLANEAEVEKAAARMFKMLNITRLVVMSMIKGGQEVIIGAKQDPAFGPVVLFGLGGVEAEALKDVSLALAPFEAGQAGRMADGLRAAVLLKGYRGRPAVSRPALLNAILRVATLAARVPQILELDLNPVMVGPGGAMAVDARVRVRPSAPQGN